MSAGEIGGAVSQEVGSAENTTVTAGPGEIFIVPQGLMHIVHNRACEPAMFWQTFDNSDAGRTDLLHSLTALYESGEAGAAMVQASGAVGIAASEGFIKLDPTCLHRCGFDADGPPGDGLDGLPHLFKVMAGLE